MSDSVKLLNAENQTGQKNIVFCLRLTVRNASSENCVEYSCDLSFKKTAQRVRVLATEMERADERITVFRCSRPCANAVYLLGGLTHLFITSTVETDQRQCLHYSKVHQSCV